MTATPAAVAAAAARVAVRGRAALVWVEGPDAAGFLQGLLSNEVAGLPPGAATRALLLDAKGHVQADLRVRRDAADAFTLVLDPAAGDARRRAPRPLPLLGGPRADRARGGRDR